MVSVKAQMRDSPVVHASRPAARAPAPEVLPGRGLAQHDFLYAGEWDTRKDSQTVFLVQGGRVTWTWSIPTYDDHHQLSEFSDIELLPDGDVLYACKTGAAEVSPSRKIVWSYTCAPGTECHSAQAIGKDRVFLCLNGIPAKAVLIDKKNGKVLMEHELRTGGSLDPKSIHGQFRHIRMTAAGTYLIAHLNLGKVIEYNRNWDSIWSVDAPSAWSAIRLKNGNTLISGNQYGYVREVDASGRIVWEVNKDDLPGMPLYTVQGVERLDNGNTVICNWGGSVRKEDWDKVVQVIEVMPDKRVVWALHQWKEPDLGPASCIQIIDR